VSAQIVNNPYELVRATIGEPQTVDPAECYDTASGELIMNVYDTLLWFDGEETDKFLPSLATSWSYDEETYTYTFTIREGVPWQNPTYGFVTPADVEYSFERWMVFDKDGGPTWMVYEPLLGLYRADMEDPVFINKIDATVENDDTNVYFKCAGPFPPLIVHQVWAQSWASIICKDWAIAQGCWDGVYTMESMAAYHNPEVSPLMDPEPVMMGAGPYIFDYWEHALEWSIYKFDGYWAGWEGREHPVIGTSRGYVERATVQFIDEWSRRKTMFLDGEVDIAYVPRAYMNEVLGQPGIRCVYPLPTMICVGVFFNYNISLRSRFLRPPFTSYECYYGELNESGLPPDFFSDVDVRKGFAYSINYTDFIHAVYDGEALYPGTPAITGLPYRNTQQEKYEFNPTKAEEHFKKAWNGQLWTTGFTLTISYNVGNLPRETICKMLKANIESLNPKFHITLFRFEWDGIIPELFAGELPLFQIGWLADYPDPHNLFHPFMHSTGAFTRWQLYSDFYVDALIEEGGTSVDPVRRQEIYYELQKSYYDDCPSVTIYQPLGRHWERTWVQGWYHNPAYPGLYFYHLWKEDLPPEDLNLDGTVNILDVVVAAKAFGSYYHVGDFNPRWNSRADFNQDQNVDIRDIAAIAKKFGSQAPPWQTP